MTDFTPGQDADGRPRPRYGEYASPEEQRARIQQPEITGALDAGVAPPAASVAVRAPRRGLLWDRILTMVILGYGLASVVTSAQQFLDYDVFAARIFAFMHVAGTPTADGRVAGVVASLILVIAWIVTFLLSLWSLRAGRLSFWIPLVAGAVANVVASVILVIPLLSEPAFLDAMRVA